jgi:predicted DNA-binding antitoxin AbrB/MazE fold protein
MRAYRGTVKNGVVQLEEGVNLPEGAIVTVTVGETEILRATLRNALQPKERKVKVKLRPMPTP